MKTAGVVEDGEQPGWQFVGGVGEQTGSALAQSLRLPCRQKNHSPEKVTARRIQTVITLCSTVRHVPQL
jgi:hypothetical protein